MYVCLSSTRYQADVPLDVCRALTTYTRYVKQKYILQSNAITCSELAKPHSEKPHDTVPSLVRYGNLLGIRDNLDLDYHRISSIKRPVRLFVETIFRGALNRGGGAYSREGAY